MKRFKNNKGFTLVEIILATLIALPMVIILMQVIPVMLRSEKQTELTSRLVILASQKLEEIRRQIASNNPNFGYNHDYNQSATFFSPPFDDYQFEVFDDQGTNQKYLQVTVWRQPGYSVVMDMKVARKN